MTDIKILENQLEGLKTKGIESRAKEALFLKAQGIDTAIQKAKADKETLATSLEKTKTKLKGLMDDKKKGVNSSTALICAAIDEFLPIGKSFFDASDSLSFGWEYEGTKQRYNSLSGGQKVIFDTALENLLGSNIMIVEAGEGVDKNHLEALLEDLQKNEKQVLVCTWYDDFHAPDGFDVVKID